MKRVGRDMTSRFYQLLAGRRRRIAGAKFPATVTFAARIGGMHCVSEKGRERAFRWIADERGTASVEYVIVLSAVIVGVAAAIFAMGPRAVALFEVRVAWLALPIP